MNDFISFIALMLAGYLGCVAFVVGMIRVFFPFRSKEEWARLQSLKTVQNHQRVSRARSASRIVNQPGQFA